MFGKKLFRFVLALSVTVMALVSWRHVLADSGHVTRGDVQAALQSWDTGLRAIRLTSRGIAAGPMDGLLRGRIVPVNDGAHYCADDWHVILVAWVTGGDRSFTRDDAIADLSGITDTFILDGVTLPITETPITRRVVPFEGDYVDYGYAFGSFLSPADLGVGAHSLTWIATFAPPDEDESFQVDSTFYVDPSDSDTCEQ